MLGDSPAIAGDNLMNRFQEVCIVVLVVCIAFQVGRLDGKRSVEGYQKQAIEALHDAKDAQQAAQKALAEANYIAEQLRRKLER